MAAASDPPVAVPSQNAAGVVYELGARVGSGGFGTVYHGLERIPDGEEDVVAIKRFIKPESALHEAKIAWSLHFHNLLDVREGGRVTGIIEGPLPYANQHYIVFDWAGSRTLWDKMNEMVLQGHRDPLGQTQWMARLLTRAANALWQCHLGCVAHRDVKATNFVVNSEEIVTLVDLGVSCFVKKCEVNDNQTSEVDSKWVCQALSSTTPGINPPELDWLWRRRNHRTLGEQNAKQIEWLRRETEIKWFKVDVFSLGLIFLQAASGQQARVQQGDLSAVFHTPYPENVPKLRAFVGDTMDEAWLIIVAHMLDAEPETRWNMRQVCDHSKNALKQGLTQPWRSTTAQQWGSFAAETAPPVTPSAPLTPTAMVPTPSPYRVRRPPPSGSPAAPSANRTKRVKVS